jgi:hypothetical protein
MDTREVVINVYVLPSRSTEEMEFVVFEKLIIIDNCIKMLLK